ncbi:DNA-binding response regulator [Geothrix oryzae]|uniref:DNA-binding response regulator n=1 Tax=Geothrix oryzae TaxID=2927975 RepID=A0ABN6UYY5_9BACT|nr:LytTR family DNA-binding domain-containing protein [Geothrix oryzae]BDU69367.1 DNA-binding response regulator [Geothrix oryzae]
MKRLKVVLVDDEPLLCGELKGLLEEQDWAWVVGVYHNGPSALAFLEAEGADLVFLDVSMPGMDGLEVARRILSLPKPPRVVFVTAHASFALEAFSVRAVDYLLKPFDADDLRRVAERVLPLPGAEPHTERKAWTRTLLVERGSSLEVVPVSIIRLVQAREGEVFVETLEGRQWPIRASLRDLEEKLDPRVFMRCHRNFIVNLDQVQQLTPWDNHGYLLKLRALRDQKAAEVPVGRAYADRIRAHFHL